MTWKNTVSATALLATALLLVVIAAFVATDTSAHTDPTDGGSAGPTEAPQNLRTTDDHGHNWLVIQWDAAPDGFTEQQLGMRNIHESNSLSWTTIASDVTEYRVTELAPESTYAMRVRVVRDGSYYQSNYVNFTTHAVPTPVPTEPPTPEPTDPPDPPQQPSTNDDFSADTGTTGQLTVGSRSGGNVEEANDRDWFAVSLTAGNTYSFELQGAGTSALRDPQIHGIYDSGGSYIAGTVNDNSNRFFWDAKVIYPVATSGTYYVSAGASDAGTGTYSLRTESVTDDYRSWTDTTGVVNMGGTVTGEINTSYEDDWFRAELQAGQTYFIRVVNVAKPDSDVYEVDGIFDANGELLSGVEQRAISRARFEYSPTQDGTHYISVTGYLHDTGTYALVVVPIGRAAAVDLGDLTGVSSSSFPEGWVDPAIHHSVYYKFEIDETTDIEFGLRQQDRDADLIIENASGRASLTSAHDGRAPETIRAQLKPGVYYARIHAQQSGRNDFVFRYGAMGGPLNEVDADATRAGATALAFTDDSAVVTDSVNGWFDIVDYKSFTLTEKQVVTVVASESETATTLERDLDMYLEDSNGNVVLSSTLPGRYFASFETIMEPGTYYLRVSAVDVGDNSYHLSVALSDLSKVSIWDTSATEGDDDALEFTLALDQAYSQPVTVGWETTDNGYMTATPGTDFVQSQGTATFEPGETRATASVPIIDDDIEDSGEKVRVDLSNPVNAVIDRQFAIGTILNADVGATRASAADIEIDGGPIAGRIDTPGDVDWFKVKTATSEERIFVTVKGASTIDGQLYNPALRFFTSSAVDSTAAAASTADNDNGTGRNERHVLTVSGGVPAGYIVEVRAKSSSDTGTYVVELSTRDDDCPIPDYSATAPDKPTACELSESDSFAARPIGELEESTDVDYWLVSVVSGKSYEIIVTGSRRTPETPLPHRPTSEGNVDPRDSEGSLVDPKLIGVLDASGTLIAGTSDDNSGSGRFARLIYTATHTGNAYITVGGVFPEGADEAGTYGILFRETTATDDMPANVGTGRTLTVKTTTGNHGEHMLIGSFEQSGDVDWFKVVLTPGTEYRFDAVARGDRDDATSRDAFILGIYDANGVLVKTPRRDSALFILDVDGNRQDEEGYRLDNATGLRIPDGSGGYHLGAEIDYIASTENAGGSLYVGGSSRFFYTMPYTAFTQTQGGQRTPVTDPATYFIAVGSYNGVNSPGINEANVSETTGSYYVGVREKTDDYPIQTDADDIELVTAGVNAFVGELEWRHDKDWFKFSAPADSRIRVEVHGSEHTKDGALVQGSIQEVCTAMNDAGTGCKVPAPSPRVIPAATIVGNTYTRARTFYLKVGAYHRIDDDHLDDTGWEQMVIGGYRVRIGPCTWSDPNAAFTVQSCYYD